MESFDLEFDGNDVPSEINTAFSARNNSTESNEINEDAVVNTPADAPTEALKGRPKRGRKRKIPEQTRDDRKRLYNNNKSHFNSKGNLVEEKTFDEHFVCSCRNKCCTVVPLDLRKRLFNQYWTMGSFAGRCVLLLTCVDGNNNTYSIFGIQVCKRALIGTLQINEGRLTVALKKMQSDTYVDGRGQMSGGRNAFPPSKIEEIRSHISSFPKYVSHYTRNITESKFLNADLNLAQMYKLYEIKFEDPVSDSVYKKIFYEDFNLRFKKPKKDTCKKCDIYKAQITNAVGLKRQMLEEWHNNHLEKAELLQAQMKSDLAEAKNYPEVETITYDMQKTLALPRVPTNIVYYKRQLNVYNCGIHVGSIDKGLFHVWLEHEASKGTQEVGSCLKKFIESITEPVKKLILWSDSCGGQNRSIRLVLMLIHALQHHPTLQTISLRYLESGHTFLPNDTEFGDFECTLKGHERVFTDAAYIKIMEGCRNENKFTVNRMSRQDFFSIQEMEQRITNRKLDVNKQKINWLETHEIVIDKSHPYIIKMKKESRDDFQSVDLGKGFHKVQTDFKNVELTQLYPNGIALSSAKIEDLMEILTLVPDEDKPFYSFLGVIPTLDFIDDVDGYGQGIDFELEEDDQ